MTKRTLISLGVVAALAAGCGQGGTASITLALSGGYYQDMTHFSLALYEAPPTQAGDEPYQEYACRPYESDGFRISGIDEGVAYYVVFKGYSDAHCKSLTYQAARGGIEVSSKKAEKAGRYYISLLKVGASTMLADPAFSNLGQLNGAPCEVAADKCGTYFSDLADAVCSDVSHRCRVFCQVETGCAAYHPRAVCAESGGETFCQFPSAYPLNNQDSRGFGLAQPLTGGDVGFLGGLSGQPGRLGVTAAPVERFNAVEGLFEVPAEPGLAGSALGGVFALRKDTWAVVGGLSRLSLEASPGKGLRLGKCPEGAPDCGAVRAIQVYDFAKGQASTSELAGSILMPVAWRLNDATAALFGGATVVGGAWADSRDGMLCSFGQPPTVECSPYQAVLNGPRVGHTGICAKHEGKLPFSCDAFLVLGGNPRPQGDGPGTTLADLMMVQESGGSYNIKPVPLASTNEADPVNHAFGLQAVAVGDQWFTFGGASFKESELWVGKPELGVYRFDVEPLAQTITPHPVGVSGLPTGGASLLHRVFHQVVVMDGAQGPLVLLVGGLGEDNRATASVLVLRLQDGALAFVKELKLAYPRFGHTVAPFSSPFLPAGLLVTGGFRLDGGAVSPVYGSEVLLPPLE